MLDHKIPLRSFRHLFVWGVLAVLVPVKDSLAQISVSIDLFAPPPVALAPPPLPIYVVPSPPSAGHLWTPGYWGWSGDDYYWVPGTWVRPPQVGLLWTPGYWGWRSNAFVWSRGYWGRRVGFYGGINYGGGYTNHGFFGGRWVGQAYRVDRRVVNVTNVTNITHVTNVTKVNREAPTTSFNGGEGGTRVVATRTQLTEAREVHPSLPKEQITHVEQASRDRELHVSANKGKPMIAATKEAAVFTPKDVVAAREAGAVNTKAEQHNEKVRKDPTLAKGAALPKAEPGGADKPQGNAAPGAKEEATPNRKPDNKAKDKATPGPAPAASQPVKKTPVAPNQGSPNQGSPNPAPSPKPAPADQTQGRSGGGAAPHNNAAPNRPDGNPAKPVPPPAKRQPQPHEAPPDAAQKPHKMPAPQEQKDCGKKGETDCKK
jgi:WXXGXW repeat (2 copies)